MIPARSDFAQNAIFSSGGGILVHAELCGSTYVANEVIPLTSNDQLLNPLQQSEKMLVGAGTIRSEYLVALF